MKRINIGIFHYPGSSKTAVYGLEEAFLFANQASQELGLEHCFETSIISQSNQLALAFDVLLLPPATDSAFYLSPESAVLAGLQQLHEKGTVLASACAGAFIMMQANVTANRAVTTHWALAEQLKQLYPQQLVDESKVLIDHGDIITAGGMMAWLDLALELIARYATPVVMRRVGKLLVVDTAPRQQRFYQQFQPSFSHGDSRVLKVQQIMNLDFALPLTVKQLADEVNMTTRTLQRRFQSHTGFSPNQYLQRLRIQKACDQLESGTDAFEVIAHAVGYEDASACRKVFIKIMGLTPIEFRRRFSSL